ncbi:hypothetical protein [Streptomyces sp. NPDC060001]|uniref:hypothetical protein n=1 Tax=Streptomyces sp. NPDC060001 TaxID=3347032 RepID=UPI0036A44BE7
MSAAEPTHPGPVGPATVITLFRGQHPSPRLTQRGGEEPVPDPGDSALHQRLADSAEELFLKHGRTLTDDDTAEAYLIALDLFESMLEGARVTGVITRDGHRELHALVEGMKTAPRLV